MLRYNTLLAWWSARVREAWTVDVEVPRHAAWLALCRGASWHTGLMPDNTSMCEGAEATWARLHRRTPDASLSSAMPDDRRIVVVNGDGAASVAVLEERKRVCAEEAGAQIHMLASATTWCSAKPAPNSRASGTPKQRVYLPGTASLAPVARTCTKSSIEALSVTLTACPALT